MSQHSIKVIYCLDGTTTTEESIVFEVDDSADALDQARTVASTASEANMRAYGRLFNTIVSQNLQS